MRFLRLILLPLAAGLWACSDVAPFGPRADDPLCLTCHGGADNQTGAPPFDTRHRSATSEIGVGAHTAHLSEGPLAGAFECQTCHVVPAPATVRAHIDGTAQVTFSGLALADSASPAWNVESASCSQTYCHGATLGGGTHTMPAWTSVGTGEAACGTCHGLPPPPDSGHPVVAGSLESCTGCHPETVDAAGAIKVAGGKHVDGSVEVTRVHGDDWTNPASDQFHGDVANEGGLEACEGCHGATLEGGAGPSCDSCHPGWQTDCTFCHGDKSLGRAAPPSDVKSHDATTEVGVGAHVTHLSGSEIATAVPCESCHTVPADALAAGHIDGPQATVTFGGVATSDSAAPTWSHDNATCSQVYCHGATLVGGTHTTPTWTNVGTGEADCGTCHALPPDTGQGTIAAGRGVRTHIFHVVNRNYDCVRCHGTGYSNTANPKTVNVALHINGVKDVGVAGSSIPAGGWKATAKTCDPSCHGLKNW